MNTVYEFGIELIGAVQAALAPGMNAFWKAVTQLGVFEFYVAAVAVIYWAWGKRRGLELFSVILAQGFLVDTIKIAAAQPRPYWLGGVDGIASSSSFGLPSGHAAASATFFGWIALEVRRWWMWVVATTLAVFVGFSRMYLGVHFPQDVLIGWLIAFVVLAVVPSLWDVLWARMQAVAPRVLVLGGLAGAMAILAIGVTAWGLGPRIENRAWAGFATAARDLEGVCVLAGAFLGVSCAWIGARGWTDQRLGGPWWRRVLACAGGLVVVLVVEEAAGLADSGPPLFRYAVAFIATAATAALIILGIPWAFRCWGLEMPHPDDQAPITAELGRGSV